jgi:hypothetical protein
MCRRARRPIQAQVAQSRSSPYGRGDEAAPQEVRVTPACDALVKSRT